MKQETFNSLFRNRTKKLALKIIDFYSRLPKKDETRILGKQLIRCSTSVGANFRAACVARSYRERYAKYCIVVEEADEMIYWLELLAEINLNINVPIELLSEATEITKVMNACKHNLKKFL